MSKGAPKEIHNLNCLSLSVLATRRHKFSMGEKNHQFCSTGKHQNHSFIGRMKTDYKPNLFTIIKRRFRPASPRQNYSRFIGCCSFLHPDTFTFSVHLKSEHIFFSPMQIYTVDVFWPDVKICYIVVIDYM
jgi:hypothetical protein